MFSNSNTAKAGKFEEDGVKKWSVKDVEELKEEEVDLDNFGPDIVESKEVHVDAFGAGIVDSIVSLEDDETMPVLTLRCLFIGISLGIFGGLLAQIYIFKPQPVPVSTLFLVIVAYAMGKGMEWAGNLIIDIFSIHRGTYLSSVLYPGPFNIKEHCALIIICSSAADSAKATQLIATAALYYKPLEWHYSIALVLSSQCLGYGLAGIFRSTLVYPEKTFYPSTLSTISVYDTLHNSSGTKTKARLKLFGGIALVMFFYEWIPLYIAPTVTAVSFFCLFNQEANAFTRMFGGEKVNKGGYKMFTNLFGGSTNNEGLGLFSLCFDWNLIGNQCLVLPWATQISLMIGTLICVIALPTMYYLNVWQAQLFPFLSQQLWTIDGTPYNQTIILDENNSLNTTAYQEYGSPYFAPSWVLLFTLYQKSFKQSNMFPLRYLDCFATMQVSQQELSISASTTGTLFLNLIEHYSLPLKTAVKILENTKRLWKSIQKFLIGHTLQCLD